MLFHARISSRKYLWVVLVATFALAGCDDDGDSPLRDGDSGSAETSDNLESSRNPEADDRRNDNSRKNEDEDRNNRNKDDETSDEDEGTDEDDGSGDGGHTEEDSGAGDDDGSSDDGSTDDDDSAREEDESRDDDGSGGDEDGSGDDGSSDDEGRTEEEEEEEAVENFALLSWQAPTHRENGDGLYLGEIKEYVISYGKDPQTLRHSITVESDGTLEMEYTIEELAEGEWYFTVQTVDYDGNVSRKADLVSKSIQDT